MEERRESAEMTREEKIESLNRWCVGHPCSSLDCRIYDICHQYPGDWSKQSDESIDKVFEALWEGDVKQQCEIDLKKAEAKRGLRAETPVLNEYIFAQDQTAKADYGKLPVNLVPTQIVRDIAEVRQYGNEKYGDPDNWRKVEKLRYVAALERHLLAYKDYLNGDDDGLDKESEIEHHKHMACNMAFICEMERWEKNKT